MFKNSYYNQHNDLINTRDQPCGISSLSLKETRWNMSGCTQIVTFAFIRIKVFFFEQLIAIVFSIHIHNTENMPSQQS